jgi:methylmalonyl-CoA/ethylmalonyl-CoA epimerase
MTKSPSEKRRRMHHVGYVVNNIDSSAPGFLRSLEATWDGIIFEDPGQKVRVTFLATGPADALVELVEPNAPDAPVLRFLRETGGGLHHLCYEIDDLEGELASMRARGASIARRPRPAVAFGGRRIAWVITAEKLLVELLETGIQSESATT